MPSFDHCLSLHSLQDKIPVAEIRDVAKDYQEQGLDPAAAMEKATQEHLEQVQRDKQKILATAHLAYAGEAGKAAPEQPSQRTIGQAAASAAGNTAGGFIKAIEGLGALFGADISKKSGVVPFDESKYQVAAEHFQDAIAHFEGAAADVAEVMRAVIKTVLEKFGGQVAMNMKPYVVRFTQDYKDGKIKPQGADHADSSTGAHSQPDSGHRPDGQPGTEPSVFDVGPPAGEGARPGADEADGSGPGSVDRTGIPGRDAAAGGAPRDRAVPGADRPGRAPGGAAEPRDTAGSGDRGHEESQPQSDAIGEPATALGARLSLDEKRLDQLAAEGVPVIPGDRDNIDATLPFLLPGQRDDVHFAETRFANADKEPGVMFTNGTGTGKTFTGLGIIKRLERQGKGNGIIIVPNDGIARDWIESGKNLGLNIRTLDSTKDHGDKGIVVTTYANFGDNKHLADRRWDFVMPDEAHYLMASKDGKQTNALDTLRAITRHPDGFTQYSHMVNRDLYAKLEALGPQKSRSSGNEGSRTEYDKILSQIIAREEVLRPEYQEADRPKTIFLSATPFAYDKAIDYAHGYLFKYPEGGRIGNSDQGGREHFFVQHFGYRIRYHKLTEPDANVDRGLMARQFNEWLKKEGALSGRMLDVEADYDRKFLQVESALGSKIDEGLDFVREHPEYKHLYQPLMKQFDYLSRRYLLEAIKAREALPEIQAHLNMGRKVAIVHDYKKGGAFNPFLMRDINGETGYWEDGKYHNIDLAALASRFRAERRDLVNLKFPQQSALDILREAHPGALIHNGDIPDKQLEANKRLFNAENFDNPIIVLQSDKGREGISLHDTTGKYQRVMVNIGMPSKPTALIQLEGRIYRTGQASDAIFRYLNTGTNWERHTFAQTIAERADTAEALAMGEKARGLKDSIIEAFEDSAPHQAGLGDGKGGKARDRQGAKILTDWDRAKAFYYSQLKRTGASKSQEGTDYFATPEPVGQKMVEWADIRPGESVLEPSAGHGAIARWFPNMTDKTVVEPSTPLITRARLAVDGNAKFIQSRFEDLHLVNKYDAIVMNPPFGTGGSVAIPHLAKAYKHLNEGGRIVALLPKGPSADAKLEKLLYGEGAPKDLHMVADIDMPSSTFERAGTGVMTHIVVLEKNADPSKVADQVNRSYTGAESPADLFDRIENATIPGRAKTESSADAAIEAAKAPRSSAAPREAAPGATGGARHFAQFEFDHTKTGERMFGTSMLNRTSPEAFRDALAIAKNRGGWYNKFASGEAKRGFLFKSAEDRADFMEKAGQLDEVKAGRDGVELQDITDRRTIEVDGERRPIQDANGRPLAGGDFMKQQRFYKWFGDSKAVDSTDRPKVMYHGTSRLTINGYDKAGTREQLDQFKADTEGGSGAIYVTDSPDYADQYTNSKNPQNGGQIYPVYVKAERPFEFYNDSHMQQLRGLLEERHQFGPEGFRDGRADNYVSESEWRHLENGSFGVLERPLVRDAIQAAGFDSYYVREHDGGWRAEDDAPNEVMTLAVFKPEQIKSATGNDGRYSSEDPSILHDIAANDDSAAANDHPLTRAVRKRFDQVMSEAEHWLQSNGKMGSLRDLEPVHAMDSLDMMMSFGTGDFSEQAKAQGRDIWDRASATFKQLAQRGGDVRGEGVADIPELMRGDYTPAEGAKRVATLAKLKAAGRARDAEKITDAEYRSRIDDLVGQLADRNAARGSAKDFERGTDWVTERLMRARRTGELNPETVNFALWALDKHPALAHDLAISLRSQDARGSAGSYRSAERVMTLFKGAENPGTAVHEILHHAERMMPDAVQSGIVDAWRKAFADTYHKADAKTRAALEDMLAMTQDRDAAQRALQAFRDGTLKYDEHYQLSNPSEYWAVNATRIMQDRYGATTWQGKAKQWLRELAEKVKGWLGLKSDNAVLKGLKSVLDGTGEHVSPQMLVERAAGRSGVINPIVHDITNQAKTPEEFEQAAARKSLLARMLDTPRDKLKSVIFQTRMLAMPMSAGSEKAMAWAKEFANNNRKAADQWRGMDQVLRDRYTEEQLAKMWTAADQENDLRREGKTSTTEGLASLTEDERRTVDLLHAYGQELWNKAKNAGMVEGDGVAYWTPRMAARIVEDGSAEALTEPGREFSKEATNLRTTAASFKHRKYGTTEESEAAGRNKHGDEFTYVRNIRVMPMAMAHMERAIAGRTLVNQIKAYGRVSGADLVKDRKEEGYDTIDHPALKVWTPRMDWTPIHPDKIERLGYEIRGNNVYDGDHRLASYRVKDGEIEQLAPMMDSEGKMVPEVKPLFIRKDFLGPLKAVFTTEPNQLYRGMMALKGAETSLIMISPATHFMVIMGKALPSLVSTLGWKNNLANLGTAGIYTMVRGYHIRQDRALMNQLIGGGLVPVSGRGMNPDIEAIANGLTPGRSITARAVGAVFDVASPKAGDLARRGIDAAGKFWHETLLWNRVADIQAGMAAQMHESLVNKGLDEKTATYMAAHFANRYAGMIPQEAMSQLAHITLNLTMFSKSFTMTNLGAYKDLVAGLPKDVQAQIKMRAFELAKAEGKADIEAEKAAGKALSQTQRIARTKAASILLLDVAAMAGVVSIVQAMMQNQSWKDFKDDFTERLTKLGVRIHDNPTDLIPLIGHPLDLISSLSQAADNPHGKEDRARVGEDEHGNSYYMRLPFGKIGEELKMYGDMTTAMHMLHNKSSTFLRPFIDLGTGEDITGKRIIKPGQGWLKQAASFAGYWVKSQLPLDELVAVKHVVSGDAHTGGSVHMLGRDWNMDQAKTLGWATGMSVTKLSGGDTVAEMRYQNREQQADLRDVLPDVREAIIRDDVGQAQQLLQDAGQTPREAQRIIRQIENPDAISKSQLRRFDAHATDAEKEKLEKMRSRR